MHTRENDFITMEQVERHALSMSAPKNLLQKIFSSMFSLVTSSPLPKETIKNIEKWRLERELKNKKGYDFKSVAHFQDAVQVRENFKVASKQPQNYLFYIPQDLKNEIAKFCLFTHTRNNYGDYETWREYKDELHSLPPS